MFSKAMYWIIGVGVLITIALGVSLGIKSNEETTRSEATSEEPVKLVESNDNEEPEEVVEISKDKDGKNPFGDNTSQEELTDRHFQEYIHGMSHQKVLSYEKWTFYELTQERVEWLSEALEVADVDLHDEYKNILDKWVQGDFSTVDDDHNAVWRMQGGNIGKAYGILSPEEEQEYLERAE